MAKQVRIGLVGYQFMGKAHSNAYRQLHRFFPELGVEPVLKALCGRSEEKVKAAAEKFGFESYETDYRKLVERDDIDIIDIVTPGDTHVEIAIAAAKAGKMVFCEKPLASSVDKVQQMCDAVNAARSADSDALKMSAKNFDRRKQATAAPRIPTALNISEKLAPLAAASDFGNF